MPLTTRAASDKVDQMDMDKAAQPRPDATLGREIQAKIGLQLRTLYNDIVGEGVPDRFVSLLDQLDQLKKPDDDKGAA